MPTSEFRLAEPLAALSVATDHVRGQPPGQALYKTIIATKLAEHMGLRAADRAISYFATLLRAAGCTATSPLRSASADRTVRSALPGGCQVHSRKRLLRHVPRAEAREAAVNEAGSLKQEDVIKALDHARIAQGPGGAAEMMPGQHHVRMNMYIAQARSGRSEIVKSLGSIDPDEFGQGVGRPRKVAASI